MQVRAYKCNAGRGDITVTIDEMDGKKAVRRIAQRTGVLTVWLAVREMLREAGIDERLFADVDWKGYNVQAVREIG